MARPSTMRQAVPGLVRTGRFLWPFTRRHRPLVAGSMLALLASVALRALEPWPLKLVFDHVIITGGEGSGGLGGAAGQAGVVLMVACVGLVLIIGLRALADYYRQVGFALVGTRVLTEVRRALYQHLQRLSLSFHTRARSGDLLVRVIGDIGLLRDVAVTALMPLLASILVLLVMVSLMLWMNWPLALLVTATLPLYALPTRRIGRRIRAASKDQRKREGAMASTAAEAIGAIHVVKALSLEERFDQTFAGQNNKSLKEGVKVRRLSARLQGSVRFLIALSTALVLWFGTSMVLRGTMSAGDLLVFLAYLKAAFRPMQDFAKYAARLAKASAAGDRVLDIFERTPDIRDTADARPAPRFRGGVAIEGASFEYEPGQPVLEALDLRIDPGEQVAIVGPSGNGKTTLLSLILRLYDPTNGRVTIDDVDIRDFTLASVRSQIAIVQQDNLLFAGSLRENVRVAAPDATDAEVEWALRLSNCHPFLEALPDGIETEVGERGVTLSAGQRQRIALARAAVRKAPILLLDEPTSGLDDDNARTVTRALEQVAAGRTVILVTHDLRIAARADRILYMRDGRIVEFGSHDELMRRQGWYWKLARLESGPRENFDKGTVGHALRI